MSLPTNSGNSVANAMRYAHHCAHLSRGAEVKAKAELKRRKEEGEREARELQEKLARERIARQLAQTKALDRANQIRAYVKSELLRATEIPIAQADIEKWAVWARQEADRIEPVKNGTIERAAKEHAED